MVGVAALVVVVAVLCVGVEGQAACGGTLEDESGTIQSPGYPAMYPHNQRCTYNIKASPGVKIKFWCEKMNLEDSVGCSKDWLALNGVHVCGQTRLSDVYVEGELGVEFGSDSEISKEEGFLCHYQRVTQTSRLCENAKYNYAEVLHKSLLFYEAQRSGVLPSTQRVTWRRDSATDDALDADTNQRIDLEGGYYDAGDYVKFGYPMAGAATMLAWGGVEYGAAYTAAGEMNYLLAAVKWATDYFIKAHVAPNEFYGQVGEGDLDHSYWGRPEDMTMRRPAFKITQSKPGSDLAGETAAALAAASILFKNTNLAYSSNCLQHARDLYNFANTYRGKYANSIPDAAKFYNSHGIYDDELAWAAAWLYRATNERKYLDDAEQHYTKIYPQGISEFSWAEKAAGDMVLLAQLADDAKKTTYLADLQTFCDRIIKNTARTPKGLVFISKWGTLRYAANAAFVCLRAADLGIKPAEYRLFGKQQIDYMLGDSGRSFVVGFGTNPPQRPHHASSSCKDPPALCSWADFSSSGPNPQVLCGALVGGPDENDNYVDNRSDYISNEVTCDYNAGFQSAVAALMHHGSCGQTSTQSPTTQTPSTTTTTTASGVNCVSISETSRWSGNYQADLVVTVPTTTSSWTITLNFSHSLDNFQVWVADASPTSGTTISLTNKYYNGNQAAGDTLTIKFWVTYSGSNPDVTSITFNSQQLCIN